MAAQETARRARALTIVALAVLALVAAALVFFALRMEPVPSAGETPMPSVSATGSPGATTTATPTPTPTPTGSAPAGTAPAGFVERLIDVSGAVAVRATAGVCGQQAPVVELSADGGVTWTASALPAEDAVQQILQVNLVSVDQVDLVVLQGPACTPNLLTTYTAGQFWQLYPERLASTSYFNPASPSVVVVDGVPGIPPCATPLELAQSGGSLAMRCAEGVAANPATAAAWTAITGDTVAAIAWQETNAGVGTAVLTASTGVPECTGVAITAFEQDASTPEGTTVGCAPVAVSPESLAIASDAGSIWVWADTQTLVSADGGASWVAR